MKVFYIDPQSYHNLSVYDYMLLTHVKGHDVVFYGNVLYQCEPMAGVRQRLVFGYSTKRNAVLKALSYVWSICRILLDVWRERPDVVHVQWLRLWQVDYAFGWLVRKMGARLVFTAHNVLPHNPGAHDAERYAQYYGMADAIIVHTERTRREMVARLQVAEEKMRVIYHGMLESGVAREVAEKRSGELRECLGIGREDVVFSCLGIQNRYKGTDMVVKAWSETEALRGNPRVRLLLVGRNQNVDFSSLAGCGNVWMVDEAVSDVDFDAYLLLSSVVLLPYREISQSGVLFTALSRGVPVLVSDVGGLTEPLRQAEVGWSIGEPTEENLKNSLLRLARGKEEIDRVRHASAEFERIRKIYSWESIGEQTSKLYACF